VSIGLLSQKIASLPERDRDCIEKALRDSAASDGHAAGVASILLDLGLDTDCVVAALFHYSLPDEADTEKIKNAYCESVASLITGARKVASISAKGKTNAEAENIRKMLFAMINDVRVLFIRLAGKLETLRSLNRQNDDEKKRVAQECLDIYAPLAGRFGVSWLKDELEDLSLKYLNHEAFLQIKNIVAAKKAERQSFLDTVQIILKREAEKSGIKIEVEKRAKHFYSIYQKMKKRNKNANEIYDLFGIRILCGTVESCYTLLGLTHSLWKPLAGRFKDYIAMPKSNGYQSLHTTVMTGLDSGGASNHIEIQIRTFDMHNVAENGIASHWLYKKGSNAEIVHENYIPVVNKLKNFLQAGTTGEDDANIISSEVFLREMKKEILGDSIFVFTPQGKVVELPAGACALDFAYTIHSAVGDHCMLAKADGRIISLGAPLQNTQVIEITTSPQAHPHTNWLNIARTSRARSKIRQWLASNDGAAAPEKNSAGKTGKKKKAQNAYKQGINTGDTGPAAAQNAKPVRQSAVFAPVAVRVENQKNMLVRFAKCCAPVQGDDIIGFVSRGRGIIIHRKDCGSLTHIKEFNERCIATEWDYASII
jgi:GTP pyrophosphokinase